VTFGFVAVVGVALMFVLEALTAPVATPAPVAVPVPVEIDNS